MKLQKDHEIDNTEETDGNVEKTYMTKGVKQESMRNATDKKNYHKGKGNLEGR